jgi:DNA-binding Lrp family transcriptional regulator
VLGERAISHERVDDLDHRLISLLRSDARLPVTSLAHSLGISRASVYARLDRLERARIILGYSVLLGETFDASLVKAFVLIKVDPKHSRLIERRLLALPETVELHEITGAYDMVVLLVAGNIANLNRVIDEIGALVGVDKTESSILLDTKATTRGVK